MIRHFASGGNLGKTCAMALLMALLICLPLAGCSGKPLDREQALTRLKSQIDEVADAVLKEDHAKMASLTHPKLVEMAGGRAKFEQLLEKVAAQIKGGGFHFVKIEFSKDPTVALDSGAWYAIVPSVLEMQGPGGVRIRQPSYLIGVCGDGSTWKFIDGAGVGNDREKLKKIIPEFPRDLVLPAKQAPVIEKS